MLVYLSEMIIFAFRFRFLLDPEWKFYKPYLYLFGICIRACNQFELQQREKISEKYPLFSTLQQYSIAILFLLMRWSEWYFSGRGTEPTNLGDAIRSEEQADGDK